MPQRRGRLAFTKAIVRNLQVTGSLSTATVTGVAICSGTHSCPCARQPEPGHTAHPEGHPRP